jgi:hypothetical protein
MRIVQEGRKYLGGYDIEQYIKNVSKRRDPNTDKDKDKKTLTLADLENRKQSRTFIKSDDDD